MKLSSACLRITITSSAVLSVLGHGALIDPRGPDHYRTPCGERCAEFAADSFPKGTDERALAFAGYNSHWFTTGTAPGCNATVSMALCYDYVNRTIILAKICNMNFSAIANSSPGLILLSHFTFLFLFVG